MCNHNCNQGRDCTCGGEGETFEAKTPGNTTCRHCGQHAGAHLYLGACPTHDTDCCGEKHKSPIEVTLSTRAKDKQIGGDHYKNMGVEPWDVVDTWPIEQRIGAYRHGALKYLMRMGSKDENAQEIAKGIHYLEKLLEVLTERDEEAAL